FFGPRRDARSTNAPASAAERTMKTTMPMYSLTSQIPVPIVHDCWDHGGAVKVSKAPAALASGTQCQAAQMHRRRKELIVESPADRRAIAARGAPATRSGRRFHRPSRWSGLVTTNDESAEKSRRT